MTRIHDMRAPVLRFVLTALLPLVAACSSASETTDPDGGLPDGGSSFELVWPPPGASLERPRTLGADADLPAIQSKLEQEPYRSWMQRMSRRVSDGRAQDADDHLRGPERMKANAARALATFYLLGWTVVDDEPLAFASPSDRKAAGAEVAELLKGMYTESRIAVPPPVGGWDRDITTSEEIILWASAYDVLLGAGYEPTQEEEQQIRDNLVTLTSALYENYRDPDTANGFPLLHQNNHRSKVGCAFIVAAIALAEHEPDPEDPRAVEYEDPAKWARYGFELLERILEYSHITEDGAYSEGPFYFRYTSQNLIPMARAWDRWVKGVAWPVSAGLSRVSPWRDPRIVRTSRWMLDVMLPDGSLAPYDDGNVGRRHYYGLAPVGQNDLGEMYWAWSLARSSQYLAAPYPFPSDGNIELAPDAIFAFDDTVVPRAPDGSPTRIYESGGVAAFRSGWGSKDVVAVVLGEHGVAASFGRGPDGDPVFPDSHEHADPASFMFYAFGERLLLDPGYLEFWRRNDVNRPQDHNMILVDGRGPVDYLEASTEWGTFGPELPPPADGMAYLSGSFDSAHADGVTVTTNYGAGEAGSPGGAEIERRFVFASNRYLVIADHVTSDEPGTDHVFAWRFHGNGGKQGGDGDVPNEGTFERASTEARWHRPGASVVVAAVSPEGPMEYGQSVGFHEPGGRDDNGDIARSSHTVWEASREGSDVHAVSVLYPYTGEGDVPVIVTTDQSITLVDGNLQSEARLQNDGSLLLVETRNGEETLRYAERGEDLQLAEVGGAGRFVETRTNDAIEWYLSPTPSRVTLSGLPFAVRTLDGACAIQEADGEATIELGGPRFGIRAVEGNGRPAAIVATPLGVDASQPIALDGSGSCDPEGSPLGYSWSLLAAPAGSRWPLTNADSPMATLRPDVPGSYRVALRVTDSEGAQSDPAYLTFDVKE